MLRRAIITVVALLIACSPSLLSHPLDNWHLRFSLPGIYGFRGISHGGGHFVALGGESQIVTSSNGQDWLIAETPATPFLRNITWGNGSFVAVGDTGTILTSTNATNWTVQSSGVTTNLQYVEFGNGVFVAIGRSVVLTSTDGAAWSRQDGPLNFFADDIAFGNGIFLLDHTPGTNLISTDGTNWSPCPSGSSNNLYCLDFGGGLFIAIDTRRKVFTSTDGSNWVQRGQVQITRPPQVAYGNNHFVVIGSGPIEYSTLPSLQWNITQLDSSSFSNSMPGSVVFANGSFYITAWRNIWQSDPVVYLESISPETFNLHGVPDTLHTIEATDAIGGTNQWQARTNLLLNTIPTQWTDPEPPSSAGRLYRARLPNPP